MGVAYCNTGPLSVVAGKTYRVAINAPPQGEIIRAQCIQQGTPDGASIFSFTFYNSAKSCPPGDPVNTAGDDTVDPMVEYGGQIAPTRTLDKTGGRYFGSDGSDGGWTPVGPYVNADGGVSAAQQKLYMKFVAGGTGIFSIFITVRTFKS